jgi:hypothetical protein
VRFDATIVRTAAVTSGVAAYRSAPRDEKCASTVSSASAIVSGRRGVDDADASARTARYGPARRGTGPGRAPEQRPRARQRGGGAVTDANEDMSRRVVRSTGTWVP